MKNTILTLAIVLGITIGASAQNRGLFDRGPERGYEYEAYDRTGGSALMLPQYHGMDTDSEAPLSGGALLLIGVGAPYALKKREKLGDHNIVRRR